VITFLIVAFAVFMMVKSINCWKREEAAAPPAEPTTKTCDYCQTEIPIAASRCPYCTSELQAA
jgi:large conductance mechanosensitive channel